MNIVKKTRVQKSYIIEEVQEHGIILDTREIFLNGYVANVDDDPGVDYRMAVSFLKNLRILESNGPGTIIVHQYSIGGIWDAGMMIYDTILHSTHRIILVMHGIAASMGSIIPQAADVRLIMPSTTFMIHGGYTSIHENNTYKQSQSIAYFEKMQFDTMLNIYTDVCINGSYFTTKKANRYNVKKFIKRKMDNQEDWYMTASQAVSYGFADSVFGVEPFKNWEIIKSL